MMMSPKVKLIVEQECKKYMVSVSDVVVKKRRSYPAINARRSIIARLYNPETSGVTKVTSCVNWGLTDVARVLNIDHTTVLHHVTQMGLHKTRKPK